MPKEEGEPKLKNELSPEDLDETAIVKKIEELAADNADGKSENALAGLYELYKKKTGKEFGEGYPGENDDIERAIM